MAPRGRRPSTADITQAVEVVRAILQAVERGEIEAETPQARRLLRRLEGAVAAWDAASDAPSPVTDRP